MDECVRSSPEFLGYGAPDPTLAALTVLGFMSLLFCLVCLSVQICRKQDKRYFARYNRKIVDDTLASLDYIELEHNATPEGDGAGHARQRRGSGAAQPNKCYTYVQYLISFLVISCVVGMSVALAFSPRIPEYSLCHKEVNWGSAFTDLSSGQVQSLIDMQFSVYNGNRFDLHIKEMEATLLYKGQDIGDATGVGYVFKAGSITDITLSTHLHPGISLASEMLAAHYLGILHLDLVMFFDSTVKLAETSLVPIRTNMTVNDLNVAGGDDTKFCKCDS